MGRENYLVMKLILKAILVSLLFNVATYASPFGCYGESESYINQVDLDVMRYEVKQRVTEENNDLEYCTIAELKKRLGDWDAGKYYELAISNARDESYEAMYRVFYGLYLRIYRGALHPVWGEANYQFNKALKIFERIERDRKLRQYEATGKDWAIKSLMILRESDGINIFGGGYPYEDGTSFLELSVGAEVKFTKDLVDHYELDPLRQVLTNRASNIGRAGWKTYNEVNAADSAYDKGFLLPKDYFLQKYKLRLRMSRLTIDGFYEKNECPECNFLNYDYPFASPYPGTDSLVKIQIESYGAEMRLPFELASGMDVFMVGKYSKTKRRGTIEWFPEADENIDQFELSGNLAFATFGPDRLILKAFVMKQFIGDIFYQAAQFQLSRSRMMYGGTFEYAFYRPIGIFGGYTRGLHFFYSFLNDVEKFGNSEVVKQDKYMGTVLHTNYLFDFYGYLNIQDWEAPPNRFEENAANNLKRQVYKWNAVPVWFLRDYAPQMGVGKAFLGVFRPDFIALAFPFTFSHAAYQNEGFAEDVKLAGALFGQDPELIEYEGDPDNDDGFSSENDLYRGYDHWSLGTEIRFNNYMTFLRGSSLNVMAGVYYYKFYNMADFDYWAAKLQLNIGY